MENAVWEYFKAGGPLMWPLLACSVAALAVLLERSWFWGRLGLAKDESRARRLLASINQVRPEEYGSECGLITAMLKAGLSAKEKDCGKAMEIIALEGLARMRRGMDILGTIITAAPILGIMGTVMGIIASFDMLGLAGVSEPKAVIAGISQALITTFAGLGIAVVTIFPYNYFNYRIDRAQDTLEIFASRLELIRARKNGG